jgi:uncharacterized Zn finger protein (UPF0148 family)
MADKLKPWRDELLKRLDEVCSRDGRVPRHVADNLVAGSAWWESHPSGPVRAPKHSDRIEGSERNWSVEFGANSFLVSAAVHGCCQCIRQWIQHQQALPVPVQSWERLAGELTSIVRGSVANYRGDTYSGYGHGTQGKLIFGAQAIYVNDFVGGIAGYLKTPALHTFQKRGPTPTLPATRAIGKTKAPLIEGLTVCPFCHCEVSASKLDSHIRKRCSRRAEVKALAVKAQQLAEMMAKPIPSLQLGPGLEICPQCKGAVKAAHLKEHKAGICPNRPTPTAQKQPDPNEAATSGPQQVDLPVWQGKVICPWCGSKVKYSRFAVHQAERCPKRPSSAKVQLKTN